MSFTRNEDNQDISKNGGAWAKDNLDPPKKQVIPPKSNLPDDIPTIPDVDDLSDTLSRDVTITKSNTSAMYEELDSELLKQYSYSSLDGINMSPLLRFIHPDVRIKEPDLVWTVESLFTDLSQYYQKDNKSE